ncbi:MAG: 3D domain-containing protein, partial [Pseudomonadota bacterium]|nr:3D domain-containing protein [Pseudomonadota bacterium]
GGGKRPLRRLMVAQDTGSAIKGPIRGDFFWGYGQDALAEAGRMKSRGNYYLLLPKSIEPPCS